MLFDLLSAMSIRLRHEIGSAEIWMVTRSQDTVELGVFLSRRRELMGNVFR